VLAEGSPIKKPALPWSSSPSGWGEREKEEKANGSGRRVLLRSCRGAARDGGGHPRISLPYLSGEGREETGVLLSKAFWRSVRVRGFSFEIFAGGPILSVREEGHT